MPRYLTTLCYGCHASRTLMLVAPRVVTFIFTQTEQRNKKDDYSARTQGGLRSRMCEEWYVGNARLNATIEITTTRQYTEAPLFIQPGLHQSP